MTSTQSLLRLATGVVAMLAFIVTAVFASHPKLLFLIGDALGASRGLAASMYFWILPFREEAGKAIGIALSSLSRNRFSWFWLTVAVAGAFGLIERVLMSLNRASDIAPHIALLFDARAIAAHIALSLVCVATAKVSGGAFRGWSIGIIAASLLHGAHNILLPRLGLGSAGSIGTAIIFVAIIVAAYVFRRRLDWRTAG